MADNTVTRLTIGVILAVFVGMYFLSLARRRCAGRGAAIRETSQAGTVGRDETAAGTSKDDESNAVKADAMGQREGADARSSAVPRTIGAKTFALAKRVACGALSGFTTMVANAGGPITSIYFLSENLSVMRFLGTTAWFYLIINMVKLPFSIGLGMITWANFTAMAWTIPLVVAAVLAGRWVARRVSQSAFSVLVYVLSVVAVVRLFM